MRFLISKIITQSLFKNLIPAVVFTVVWLSVSAFGSADRLQLARGPDEAMFPKTEYGFITFTCHCDPDGEDGLRKEGSAGIYGGLGGTGTSLKSEVATEAGLDGWKFGFYGFYVVQGLSERFETRRSARSERRKTMQFYLNNNYEVNRFTFNP